MSGNGIVIVGAGHGGSQLATSLRQEGFDGPITLVSDETDVPYHKPPLSKAFLKTPDMAPQLLRAESTYTDNAITLRFGARVSAIDLQARRLELDDGAPLPFDRLVLATGARARRLAIPGHDLTGIFTLRTADDARALRAAIPAAQSVAVIGGGFVGLEAAASLAGLGKQVTVIEAADRILGRVLAPAMSAYMAGLHQSLGVKLLTGTGVARLDGANGRVTHVTTTDGTHVAADMVIVGIGANPDIGLATQAGLACDNGIVVDGALRTSVPEIFAIGDCVAYAHWQTGSHLRLESVQNATDQARHAARVLAGKPEIAGYREVPWFWSDQGPAKLQMVGLAIGTTRQVISGTPANGAFSIYHFRDDRLQAIDSINRPADHMLGRRMLAANFHPDDALIAAGPAALKAAFAEFSKGQPEAR
ncbi:NAD(P)/FAD-dependent oxidoreductase [Bradyrhizobium sp. 2TAF24]|uniref:NAD(P)/FAD-dependent oxidoreductase n=1 Tax=Bradyrhizobium sp. 2TAF24 TaxID=3233011 RepID=UPI003F93F29E